MKKRTKSLVAMLLMMTLLLSACGEKMETMNKGTVDVSAVNEFPIVKEPLTLTVFANKNANISDITTNEFTKWYEEKTGIKIEWELVTGDVRQAINLQIASEDYPDIFLGFDFARSEQAAYYNQDVFIDLTDLIEEHGYHIKKMFENDPSIEKNLRHTDNKILGLPSLDLSFLRTTPNKMWVYKPWIDKLGADIPQTTEEFYELLKRFKTEDPNGNGIADEVPLASRNSRGGQSGLDLYLMSSFLSWGTYGFSVDENGDAVFAPIQDEAKEGIRYIKKLYEEGLIHTESFVMDKARMTALSENEVPILGCAPGVTVETFTIPGSETGRYEEFVALPPLEGPNGVRQTMAGGGDSGLTSFSITTSCENPEAAIKWIDWFYSEEAYLKSRAPEGFRLAKDGEIGYDGKPAKFAQDQVAASSGAADNSKWGITAVCYWPQNNSISVADNTENKIQNENAYNAYLLYKPYERRGSVVVDFPVPDGVAEEYLELRSNIKAEIDSGFVSFIIGEKDIDKDWDVYVKRFYDLGLERYTEIVQNYLDSVK